MVTLVGLTVDSRVSVSYCCSQKLFTQTLSYITQTLSYIIFQNEQLEIFLQKYLLHVVL